MIDTEALKKIFDEKGISGSEVSRRIGMPYRSFSRKINGWNEFSEEQIQKIVEVLDIKSPEPIFFSTPKDRLNRMILRMNEDQLQKLEEYADSLIRETK